MATDAIACPACGARNKPKWEYCARCGESLQGAAPIAAPAKAAPPKAGARGKGKSRLNIQIHEREPASSIPPGALVALGVVLLAVLGLAGWRYASQYQSTDKVDPNLFTLPTKPSARPTSQPPATGPGATEFNEGMRMLSAGKTSEALGLLAQAASAAPENARYQSVYGEALLAAGSKDEALARFADAARLDPQGFRIQYGRALITAGREAEAASVLEGALGADGGGNPGLAEELAKIYYKTGNYAKAAPLLDKAIESRPADPVLRQEAAYAASQTGNKARAEELYKSVLEIAPGADVSRIRLSEMLFEQGKGEEALTLLKQGIEVNPSTPDLHRRLGNMLERAGKPQEAVQRYREYAKLAPNAPDAKDLEERARRLEGAGKS
jgi:predicted Zn-dependent protease